MKVTKAGVCKILTLFILFVPMHRGSYDDLFNSDIIMRYFMYSHGQKFGIYVSLPQPSCNALFDIKNR